MRNMHLPFRVTIMAGAIPPLVKSSIGRQRQNVQNMRAELLAPNASMAQITARGDIATPCLSEIPCFAHRKPWLTKAMSIKLVLVAALLNLILQAAQVAGGAPSGIPDWVNGAEHLGLTGALMLAVVILWRAYQS